MGVILDDFSQDLDDILAGKKPRKRVVQPQVQPILDRMRGGTSGQESSGNTKAVNSRTGATGEFQVMPANIPNWTRKYYGQTLNQEQFKNNPQAQKAVFDGEMGSYLTEALKRSKGDEDLAIRMAAMAWYGRGIRDMHRYDDPTVFRAGEPSRREYTLKVLGRTKGQTRDSFADFVTGLDKIIPPQKEIQNFERGLDNVRANPLEDFEKGLDNIIPKPSPTNPANANIPVVDKSVLESPAAEWKDPSIIEGTITGALKAKIQPKQRITPQTQPQMQTQIPKPTQYVGSEPQLLPEGDETKSNDFSFTIDAEGKTAEDVRQAYIDTVAGLGYDREAIKTALDEFGLNTEFGKGEKFTDIAQVAENGKIAAKVGGALLDKIRLYNKDIMPSKVLTDIAKGKEVDWNKLAETGITEADFNAEQLAEAKEKGEQSKEQYYKLQEKYLERFPDVADLLAKYEMGLISGKEYEQLEAERKKQIQLEKNRIREAMKKERADAQVTSLGGVPLDSLGRPIKEPTDEEVNAKYYEQPRLSERETDRAVKEGLTVRGNGTFDQIVKGAFFYSGGGSAVKALAGAFRPFSDTVYKFLNKTGQEMVIAGETSVPTTTDAAGNETQTWVGSALNFLGRTPVDLSRLYLFTRLGGKVGGAKNAAVIGFSLDHLLTASGEGKNISEVAKEAVKGGAMGALFTGASVLKQLIPNTNVAQKIIGETVKLGTIGAGTYGMERASGATDEEAFKAAIQNTLFDMAMSHLGKVKGMPNKILRFWKDGKSKDILVKENGDYSEIKNPVDEKYVDSTIDVTDAEPILKGKLPPDTVRREDLDTISPKTKISSEGNTYEKTAMPSEKKATKETENKIKPETWGSVTPTVTPTFKKINLAQETLPEQKADSALVKSEKKVEQKEPYEMTLREYVTNIEPRSINIADLKRSFVNNLVSASVKESNRLQKETNKIIDKLLDEKGNISAENEKILKQNPLWQKFVKPDRFFGDLNRVQDALSEHRENIEQALKEGKTVSKEVLADYPDLAKQQKVNEKSLPESSKDISEPFAQNKIFTADKVAKAREVLKKKGTQFNTGFDPEELQALVTIAGAHIENGARKFADFSREMVKDFGEGVRNSLPKIYESIRKENNFSGMEEQKFSKVGKDIEAKTIADNLTEGFKDTANYDPVTWKEQAKLGTELVNQDIEKARRIVNGQEALPNNLRAATVINAVEQYARKNNDVVLLQELARSTLTSETSTHAQELNLLKMRNPLSPLQLIQDVQKIREGQAQKRLSKKTTIKEAIKTETNKMKAEIQAKITKPKTWGAFIESISCKS